MSIPPRSVVVAWRRGVAGDRRALFVLVYVSCSGHVVVLLGCQQPVVQHLPQLPRVELVVAAAHAVVGVALVQEAAPDLQLKGKG